MLKIQGLDKLQRQLDDLSRKARAVHGTHDVPMDQLLTPAFMARHTGFTSIAAFLQGGGFSVQSRADLEAIPTEKLDAWVREQSKFHSWKEMLESAGGQWVKSKLGLS